MPCSAVLLKRFVMGGVMLEAGKEDTYEHVAMILTNVTRFKQVRLHGAHGGCAIVKRTRAKGLHVAVTGMILHFSSCKLCEVHAPPHCCSCTYLHV